MWVEETLLYPKEVYRKRVGRRYSCRFLKDAAVFFGERKTETLPEHERVVLTPYSVCGIMELAGEVPSVSGASRRAGLQGGHSCYYHVLQLVRRGGQGRAGCPLARTFKRTHGVHRSSLGTSYGLWDIQL